MIKAGTRGRSAQGTRPFALFAECLLTGVWFTLFALPLVTVPAALAASSRHLAHFLDGTPCSFGDFVRDFRVALRTAWRAGLVVVAGVAVLVLDIVTLSSGVVPGQALVAPLTLLIAAIALTVLLRAAAGWEPGASWRELAQGAAAAARSDLGGTGILLGGLLVTVVCTWALWILFIPMSGCVVGAALAVHRRAIASTMEET